MLHKHKIFFSTSIEKNQLDQEKQKHILSQIHKYGTLLNGSFYIDPQKTSSDECFSQVLDYIDQASLIIAEVSYPSHGVGWELCYAQYIKKIPILCLYDITLGLPSSVIEWNEYLHTFPYENIDDITKIMQSFFTHRL
jgi:2'-deoxynucleoside 5'-phosphate N-hydrolase